MTDVDPAGDDPLSLNFWPAFADLMLALSFVLILVLFLVAFGMQAGNVGIEQILEKQRAFAATIAEAVDGEVLSGDRGAEGGEWSLVCVGGACPIGIVNDIQLQRITFSDRVLFASGRHDLSDQGRAVLRQVGQAVRNNIGDLYKIQIEGHTDDRAAPQYSEGNLELGARRAIAVYRFLQRDVGIDPASHLMSATSYGEFSPVDRREGAAYSAAQVAAANDGDPAANRRVELLLFYKRPGQVPPVGGTR